MEEIKKLQEDCLSYCKSKVDIATQNYDIVFKLKKLKNLTKNQVDKQIEKLDAELKKFEDEIKGQTVDLQEEIKDAKKHSKFL